MSIEMRHPRYVVAAAEHGSFRRAARALGVQACAVSRRIADLEDEIGATLFVRCSAGVALTYGGAWNAALVTERACGAVATMLGCRR